MKKTCKIVKNHENLTKTVNFCKKHAKMLKVAKNQPKQQVFVINMQKCQKQKLSKTFKNAENYEISAKAIEVCQ